MPVGLVTFTSISFSPIRSRPTKYKPCSTSFGPTAETIADTHWHRTQDVVWRDDGSIEFTCTVDGLDEIVWWVMGMGPHCVVRKPAELVDRVRALAEQLYRQYPESVGHRPATAAPRMARAKGRSR